MNNSARSNSLSLKYQRLHHHVAKIQRLENKSLWQELGFFLLNTKRSQNNHWGRKDYKQSLFCLHVHNLQYIIVNV